MITKTRILSSALRLALVVCALCAGSSARANENSFFDIGGISLPSAGLSADEAMPWQDVREVVQILREEKDVRSIFARWAYGAEKRKATREEFAKKNLSSGATSKEIDDAYGKYERSLNALAQRLFETPSDADRQYPPTRFTNVFVLKRETFGDLIVAASSNGCVVLELDVDNPIRRRAIAKATLYRFDSSDVVELSYDEELTPRRYVAYRFTPRITFYDLANDDNLQAVAEAARDPSLNRAVRLALRGVGSIERATLRVVEWNENGAIVRDEKAPGEPERVEISEELAETRDDADSAERDDAIRSELCENAIDKCKRYATLGQALERISKLDDFANALEINPTGKVFTGINFSESGGIAVWNDDYCAEYTYYPKFTADVYAEKDRRKIESFTVEGFGSRTILQSYSNRRGEIKSAQVFKTMASFDRPAIAQLQTYNRQNDKEIFAQYVRERQKKIVAEDKLLEIYLNDAGDVEIERRYVPFEDASLETPDRAPIFAFPKVAPPTGDVSRAENFLIASLAAFTEELAKGADVFELATFSGFDPFVVLDSTTLRNAQSNDRDSAYKPLNLSFKYDAFESQPSELSVSKGLLRITLTARDGSYFADVRYADGANRVENARFEIDANGVARSLTVARPKRLFERVSPLSALLASQCEESEFNEESFKSMCADFDARSAEFVDLHNSLVLNIPRTEPVGERVVWDENGARVPSETIQSLDKRFSFTPNYWKFVPEFNVGIFAFVAPSARHFPKRLKEPIFGAFPTLGIDSRDIPLDDLARIDAMIPFVEALRTPTTLDALSAKLALFPITEVLGGASDLEPGAREIAINYEGGSLNTPRVLTYATSSGRIVVDCVGNETSVSALAIDGSGATLVANSDGAVVDFYAHRRDRARFKTALPTSASDATVAKFEAALQEARLNDFDARFLAASGAIVDVVRHYRWRAGGRVGVEFWDRPVEYEQTKTNRRGGAPNFTVRRPGDSTYNVSYDVGASSVVTRASQDETILLNLEPTTEVRGPRVRVDNQ